MAINFPDTPTVGQAFTVGDRTWTWSGTTWNLVSGVFTHAASHAAGQSDPVTLSQSQVTNLVSDLSTINSSLNAKAALGSIDSADFNSVTSSGIYRFNVPSANGPGFPYSQLLVLRDINSSDTIAQMAIYYADGTVRVRAANALPSSPNWTPWRTLWAPAMDIGGNYTIVAGDSGKTIRSTGGAITVTITNVLNPGDRIDFIQDGAGQITFAASGVTLQSKGAKLKTSAQYAGATVFCVAAGQYRLIGDLG
jgi:hypothetical protein